MSAKSRDRIRDRVAVATVLLAVVVLLAACGGGGGSSTHSGLTKAAYVKRATAICHAGILRRNAEMSQVSRRLGTEGKVPVSKQRAELVRLAIAPAQKQMVAELAKLQPPAADAVTIEKIVKGFEGGIERLERDPSVAFESVVVTPANVAAEKFGMPECWV